MLGVSGVFLGDEMLPRDVGIIIYRGLYDSNLELIHAWMSQEVSKWLVNGLFHLPINGVFLGVKKPTGPNLLLTSWDIQVGPILDLFM